MRNLLAIVALSSVLQGCAVIAVADAGVTVAATTVSVAATGVGIAVKTTAAVVDYVIPDFQP